MKTFLLSLGMALFWAMVSATLASMGNREDAPFLAFAIGLPVYLIAALLVLPQLPAYLARIKD